MLLGIPRGTAIVLALSLLLLLLPASAICEEFPVQGQIGLSFAPDAWVHEIHIQPFEPFDFYVRADMSADGGEFPITVTEASLHYASQIFISEIDDLGANASTMLSLDPGVLGMVWGWAVNCDVMGEGLTVVLRLRAVVTEVADEVLIGVQDLPGGVFEGLGPGWYDCATTGHFLFEEQATSAHWQLSLVTSNVPTGKGSWGTLKASFPEEVQP